MKKLKNSIFRDVLRRKAHFNYELKRLELKAISCNNILPINVRLNAAQQLALCPRDSSITRSRNLCIFTGRDRGNLPKFGISRMIFRKFAEAGMIPGVRKASF